MKRRESVSMAAIASLSAKHEADETGAIISIHIDHDGVEIHITSQYIEDVFDLTQAVLEPFNVDGEDVYTHKIVERINWCKAFSLITPEEAFNLVAKGVRQV